VRLFLAMLRRPVLDIGRGTAGCWGHRMADVGAHVIGLGSVFSRGLVYGSVVGWGCRCGSELGRGLSGGIESAPHLSFLVRTLETHQFGGRAHRTVSAKAYFWSLG